MKRSILLAVLFAFHAGVLSGCGSGSETPGTTEGAPPSEEVSAGQPATPPSLEPYDERSSALMSFGLLGSTLGCSGGVVSTSVWTIITATGYLAWIPQFFYFDAAGNSVGYAFGEWVWSPPSLSNERPWYRFEDNAPMYTQTSEAAGGYVFVRHWYYDYDAGQYETKDLLWCYPY